MTLHLVENKPLYIAIAETEFSETTADALTDRLSRQIDANRAPALDLLLGALHYADQSAIGSAALLDSIQRHRIFG